MANMILDLSVYQQQTLDITLLDGSILHIKKPTQGIVIAMMALGQLQENNAPALIDGLVELCVTILNNNKDGRTFTFDWVAENLDITLIYAIVKAYTDFTQELQSNPI